MSESVASLKTAARGAPELEVVDDEAQTRLDLAACYRLVAHHGWTDMVYTHLSARVPGPQEHFLLNPFGWGFDEVNASSLVKIDLEGNTVGETEHDIHRAGFVIHSAIHEGRPDAKAVLHTHSVDGIAVSAMDCGLLPLSQHAQLFHGHVAYHDYEGLAVDMDERQRLVADLGDKPVMILRNHGLLVVGDTISEAFSRLFHLEKACSAQVAAMASVGGNLEMLVKPDPAVSEKTAAMGMGSKSPLGKHEWPALLRLLDRKGTDWRQ